MKGDGGGEWDEAPVNFPAFQLTLARGPPLYVETIKCGRGKEKLYNYCIYTLCGTHRGTLKRPLVSQNQKADLFFWQTSRR